MSSRRDKALDRARKLKRTAASESGATEHEQKTAQKMLRDLVDEHGFTDEELNPRDEYRRRPRGERREHPPQAHPRDRGYTDPFHPDEPSSHRYWCKPGWGPIRMVIDSTCGSCGATLYVGNQAFKNFEHGFFRHFNYECNKDIVFKEGQ